MATMMRKLLATLSLIVFSSAYGCDTDPAGTDDDFIPRDSVILAVVGHGAIVSRFTAEIAVAGDWAYTTTWNSRNGVPGNAIFVWDVSTDTPVLSDSVILPFAGTIGDVQISEDGALLVVSTERTFNEGSIVIFDRAHPSSLVQFSRFKSASTESGVHTIKLSRVDGRHLAFLSVNIGATPSKLVIVDMTDPTQPTEVLARNMGSPWIHDVYVRDGLLFTALWNDGLTIWDIGGAGMGGTPENPIIISNIKTVGGHVHNVWWFHNSTNGERRYAFVGEEVPGIIGATSAGDIHVVDISDITNPREVAFYTLAGAGTHNFVMDEDAGILYAAYYNGGVRALDVRGDLGTCSDVARAGDGRCDLGLAGRVAGVALSDQTVSIWGVALSGNTLYASDMLSGLFGLNVAALAQ
jgi:hypothetical protein